MVLLLNLCLFVLSEFVAVVVASGWGSLLCVLVVRPSDG